MSSQSPRKIVIFDIDGTLVVESSRLRTQAQSVSAKFGASPAELQAVIYAFFSINDYASTTMLEIKHNIPVYMEMMGEKLQIPVSSTEAAELAVAWSTAYTDSHKAPELFQDVLPCLDTLRDRGFELVVASGSTLKSRQSLLDTTGTAHFFSRIFAAIDVGYQKQDIRFWQCVLDELKVGAGDQVSVIGNQLNDDIFNPIALGLSAFLIDRPSEFKKILEEPVVVPTATLPTLSELVRHPYFAQ